MTMVSPAAAPRETDRLYTAEDLLAFPPGARYELIDGRLRQMPPTGDEHGSYTIDLSTEINYFVRSRGLGRCRAAETGFLLARDPDYVLAPDFAFIAADRLPPTPVRGFLPVVPDLVLETRSPSDRGPAVRAKVQEWLDAGVRIVLDLDPTRGTLTIYRPDSDPVALTSSDTLTLEDVLPGFALPLSRLFPEAK
jgi:Uma2 family endonuclease